jgi:hypothetical protein
MPEQDPSTTPGDDARKAELEALFRQWEQGGRQWEQSGRQWEQGGPEAGNSEPQAPRRGVRGRFLTTLALLGVTLFVMASTWQSVAYWLEPSEPRHLGDVRARFGAGEVDLGARGNTHVALDGLIPTRLMAVTAEDPEEAVDDADIAYIFFCPLYNITVLTSQKVEVPTARMPIIEGDMAEIVSTGLAFPADTLVRVSAAGRLLPGSEAPPNLRDFVASFAKRLELDPARTWVLVDGHVPASETIGVIIWGVAIIPPLVSLAFLVAAMRARRRAQRP